MKKLNQLLFAAFLLSSVTACSDSSSEDGDGGNTGVVPAFEIIYEDQSLTLADDEKNLVYLGKEITLVDKSTGEPTTVKWTFSRSGSISSTTVTADAEGEATHEFTDEGTYNVKMMADSEELYYESLIVTEEEPAYASTAIVPEESDKEWGIYPISYVEVEDGKEWKLIEGVSDEFNDSFAPTTEKATMNGKWNNYYLTGGWQGPNPTEWQRDHVWIEDSKMKIKATREDNPLSIDLGESYDADGYTRYVDETFTGCATAVTLVQYPVYIEAYAKLSNSTMASDVWMLSSDSTQEIDIIEAYGSDRYISDYFSPYKLHLSHHVFIRDPFTDYQPQDAGTHYSDGKGTKWRDGYHRVGVLWLDPTHLYYYVNGVLARSVNDDGETEMIDPNDYTEGSKLSKEMNVIINMEDQTWRAAQGFSPTRAELSDLDNMTYNVEWIRAYQLHDVE